MKNISTFALLFWSIFLYSQVKEKQEYVYLKRQTDTTRTFKATIANQPVTIFLKYKGIVDCKLYVHYVDGWYYYDKYKVKIPLTGVYNGGEITLINFENKKDENKFVENLMPYLVEKADSIALKNNAKEIIKFNYDIYSIKQKYPQEGFFKNKHKEYPAKLFSRDNTIYRENEYLILPNGQTYNTYDIIDNYAGNKLLSCALDKTENRVLLYYEHLGNHNACGNCGADIESGYRVLSFTKNWKLSGIRSEYTYYCPTSYNMEKLPAEDQNIRKYKGGYYNEPPNLLTINVKNATMTKLKL